MQKRKVVEEDQDQDPIDDNGQEEQEGMEDPDFDVYD